MNNARTRLIIAVTQRLSAAAESEAKTELIEELSENLYSRYQDLTAAGAAEDEAYRRALEELGDVDELLAYLDSLGPKGKLPRQEGAGADLGAELFQDLGSFDWGGFARQTVEQARQAAEDAAAMVRDAADQFMGQPHTVHSPAGTEPRVLHTDGGDPCDGPRVHTDEDGTAAASEGLRSVRVELGSGDVQVELDSDPAAPVRLSGDTEELRLSVVGDTLVIRQGRTASGTFFFGRAIRSTDIRLTLPRRRWDSLSIQTGSGEVRFGCAIEADSLSVSTSDGDIRFLQDLDADSLSIATHTGDVAFRCVRAGQTSIQTASGDVAFAGALDGNSLNVVTASGDLELQDARIQTVQVRTASGDFDFRGGQCGQLTFQSASGDFDGRGTVQTARIATMSGDIQLSGSILEGAGCTSASGCIQVRTDVFPRQLELMSRSGDCSAAIPDNPGFTLQFRTVSGELSSNFQLVGPVGARSGQAVYRDGGPTFRMGTTSGELELNML